MLRPPKGDGHSRFERIVKDYLTCRRVGQTVKS